MKNNDKYVKYYLIFALGILITLCAISVYKGVKNPNTDKVSN
jgi:hypothetical protein